MIRYDRHDFLVKIRMSANGRPRNISQRRLQAQRVLCSSSMKGSGHHVRATADAKA